MVAKFRTMSINCVGVCACAWVFVCVYVYMCACVVYVCVCECVYVCVCVCVYVCVCILQLGYARTNYLAQHVRKIRMCHCNDIMMYGNF